MKILKILWVLLLNIFILSLITACTQNPPDVPLCRELKSITSSTTDVFGIPSTTIRANPLCAKFINESTCGYCTWTISQKEQYVGESSDSFLNGKPWSQIKAEAILTPSESLAAVKAYIIKSCRDASGPTTGTCAEVGKWQIKLDSLGQIIKTQ